MLAERSRPARTQFLVRCASAYEHARRESLLFSLAALKIGDRDVEQETRLYVVHDPAQDVVKIGVSKNPPARLANLQVANASPLELAVDVLASTRIEQLVHRFLKEDCVSGEWFSCTPRVLTVCEILYALGDWELDHPDEYDAHFALAVLRTQAEEVVGLVEESA